MLFIDKLSSLQALSVINKTTPRPINLYGQAGTTVTGNLSAGVLFHMPAAGCEDAGVYQCTFRFTTVRRNFITKQRTVGKLRLDWRESDSDSDRFNTVHVPEFQKLMADMTQINGQ
ncbi:hypothetical protein ACOMHN_053035 [Nucella lapillus]